MLAQPTYRVVYFTHRASLAPRPISSARTGGVFAGESLFSVPREGASVGLVPRVRREELGRALRLRVRAFDFRVLLAKRWW